MENAKGYAKTRQRTVAIAAREILLTSAGIYLSACSTLVTVKSPETSVKAKYPIRKSGMIVKRIIHTI
jgi:hypothetical protein